MGGLHPYGKIYEWRRDGLRKGVVKSWTSTQASVGLSVGEAEFYAGVKAAAAGAGYVNILQDMRLECKVALWTESSTA